MSRLEGLIILSFMLAQLDKEYRYHYSENPDWRDVRAVEGGGLENR